MQKDFQTNIEEIHEDYLKRIENAKRKSDVEVDNLKKEVESKENDIGSKIANALKELTQEMKTREVKQNEALRSALKTLARKPNGAVEKDDMKEIKELISKSDDLTEIKELISKINLASACDNDGWLFFLTLEYNNKMSDKTEDVNRLIRKTNKLNTKLNKVKEVSDSRIKDLEETLAKCTSQLKARKLKVLKTRLKDLGNIDED